MSFGILVLGGVLLFGAGCTRESLRVALAAQQEANRVDRAVAERRHDALRVLLFRDAVRRLEAEVGPLGSTAVQALSDIWNDRDLMEFWLVQDERAAALRTAGVDAKLYSDQSMVDLLAKNLSAKAGHAESGLAQVIAARAGRIVGEAAADAGSGGQPPAD